MSSSARPAGGDRLTPFSYVILVLVGRGGAGPHDLRRNAEQGRMFWTAAPSQWYAETKRLGRLGYLEAQTQPGRTRARTHYTLNAKALEALDAWARTPVSAPRMQHEFVVRLLSADLVEPGAVLEGLAAMRAQVEEDLAALGAARARWSRDLPHRKHLLEVNDHYAERLLRLQLEWLEEAQATLRG